MMIVLFDDQDPRSGMNLVKQSHDIQTGHADAAMGFWLARDPMIRAAMDINIAPGRVNLTVTVDAWLKPAQPKYAGQYPIAAWVFFRQFGIINLAGGPPTDEYGIAGQIPPNFRTDRMPTTRSATRTPHFPRPVLGRGNPIAVHGNAIIH